VGAEAAEILRLRVCSGKSEGRRSCVRLLFGDFLRSGEFEVHAGEPRLPPPRPIPSSDIIVDKGGKELSDNFFFFGDLILSGELEVDGTRGEVLPSESPRIGIDNVLPLIFRGDFDFSGELEPDGCGEYLPSSRVGEEFT